MVWTFVFAQKARKSGAFCANIYTSGRLNSGIVFYTVIKMVLMI
jgi:hypothetical protein